MPTLDFIVERHTICAARAEPTRTIVDVPSKVSAEAIGHISSPIPADITTSLPLSLPPAAPCHHCSNPIHWLDPYGGLHCENCEPRPKVKALVRKRLVCCWVEDPVKAAWEEFS